ncbi:hypothetical protein EON64_07230 [archaeon]|nr:MAG: hypothetical protein EON64_07230 [archaeon]
MEASQSGSQAENASRSNKRKSGDWEDDSKPVGATNEKVIATAAKKLKGDVTGTKDAGRPFKSSLPRPTASTRSKTVTTNPTPTPTPVAAPVATPSANNPITPRTKGYTRVQTPAREILRPTGAEAAIQDTLIEIGLSSIKGKLESMTTTNTEKLTAIANSLKTKSKQPCDTKDKLKRQENALKNFKEAVVSVNEELHSAMDTVEAINKKLVATVTKTVSQHHLDANMIRELREKETELAHVTAQLMEERGNSKNALLQQKISYDERIHKLESSQLSQSTELAAKEKEIAQLETQLKGLKKEYEAAQKVWNSNSEQVRVQ